LNIPADNQEQTLNGYKLEISGSPFSQPKAIVRTVFAIIFLGLSAWAFLWTYRFMYDADSIDLAWTVAAMGLMALVFGALLPLDDWHFLDLDRRMLVNVRWYGLWVFRHKETALSKFSAIVLRHLCYPNGEDGRSYSGAVGLRHPDGPVLWLKNFATNCDQIPSEAWQLARLLAEITALPIHSPGIEPLSNPSLAKSSK
jgi:hypothetical protein